MQSDKNLTSSIGWSYLLDGSRLLAQFVIVYIIADLIGPGSWGAVSIATQFVFFAEVLQQQGLLSAIIQRRRLQNRDACSAYWLLIGTSLVMATTLVALSGWLGEVYESRQLTHLLRALAVGLVIRGASLVPEALMRRDMAFRMLALRTNAAVLLGVIVGLGSAAAGAGAWAIVAEVLTQIVVEFFLIWRMTEWRPQLRFSWERLKGLLAFSMGSFLAGIGLFTYMRVEAFLITPILGSAVVGATSTGEALKTAGLYLLGFRLVEQGSQLAVRAVQSVSLPELSRLQNDHAAFNHRLGELLRFATAVSAIVMGPLAALAPDLLDILGEEWSATVRVVQILCIAGVLKSINTLAPGALQAAGRPYRTALLSWAGAIAMTAAAVAVLSSVRDWAVADQLQAMAWTRVVFELAFLTPLSYFELRRSTGIKVRTAFGALRPGALAAAATFAAVAVVRWAGLFDSLPALVRLFVHGGVAVAVLFPTLWAVEPEIRARVRSKLGWDVDDAEGLLETSTADRAAM